MRINATAKRDFPCPGCGNKIRVGDRIAMYRERALSYREASHAGTLYPMRKRCAACVAKKLAAACAV